MERCAAFEFKQTSFGVRASVAYVGIEIVGETLQVIQAILDLSPFAHVPAVLASGLSLMPLVFCSRFWR
jgi:hypothetical protein